MSRFKRVICREVDIVQTPTGGYIVQIGCQRFVYEDPSSVAQLVMDYLMDPEKLEKEFHSTQDRNVGRPEEVQPPEQAESSQPSLIRR